MSGSSSARRFLDGGGGQCVVPAVVGFDSSAVKRDLAEPHRADGHGNFDNLLEERFELRFELGEELGVRGVIGLPSLGEPDEIDVVNAGVLERPAGFNLSSEPINPEPGEDSGMDWGLSA